MLNTLGKFLESDYPVFVGSRVAFVSNPVLECQISTSGFFVHKKTTLIRPDTDDFIPSYVSHKNAKKCLLFTVNFVDV